MELYGLTRAIGLFQCWLNIRFLTKGIQHDTQGSRSVEHNTERNHFHGDPAVKNIFCLEPDKLLTDRRQRIVVYGEV